MSQWGNVPICIDYFIDPNRDIFFSFFPVYRDFRVQGQLMKSSPRAGTHSWSCLEDTWRMWVFTNTGSWTQALWLNRGFPTYYNTPPWWLMINATCMTKYQLLTKAKHIIWSKRLQQICGLPSNSTIVAGQCWDEGQTLVTCSVYVIKLTTNNQTDFFDILLSPKPRTKCVIRVERTVTKNRKTTEGKLKCDN